MSRHVTKTDAAGLVCRGLSLLLFVWGIADLLLLLPDRLAGLVFFFSDTSSDTSSTMRSYEVVTVIGIDCSALRLGVLFGAAIVLSCRPRFLRRLLGEDADDRGAGREDDAGLEPA